MKIWVGLAIAALGASAAQAQEGPAPLNALERCRTIADDTMRLACFDRAAAVLAQSVEKKEVVVLDREEARKTRRSLFGFTLPRLKLFGNEDDDREEREFTEIDSTVKSARGLGYGKLRFTIEDGAVWQTTEAVRMDPKPGDKVNIKKGTMGSYFVRFDDGRAVRGMRVN